MENYQLMKAFIGSAKEYTAQRTDTNGNTLQRYLNILSTVSDVNLFDPGSSEAAEFYVSLYELMSGLEARCELVWCSIRVLQEACRNCRARAALINTYKFTPILTRYLGAPLIPERRLRILRLIQELTYGVKISWQEAHLPFLISMLVKWISNEEGDIISVALGVLVNLCYKNLPAIYTLMRSTDIKEFIRRALKLQKDISTKVQVCKLLIILEHVSGEVPDAEIRTFVSVTFATLNDVLRSGNYCLMRHLVDFFKDIRDNAHFRSVLVTYPNYIKDTESLVDLLYTTEGTSSECICLVLEFLHVVVLLQLSGMETLYIRILKYALQWTRTEGVSTQALQLVCTITIDLRRFNGDPSIRDAIMESLEDDLTVLLLLLDTGGDACVPSDCETRCRLTALLQLLHEMTFLPNLYAKIEYSLSANVMRKLFEPLISTELKDGENLFQSDVNALYVQGMCLISALSVKSSGWLHLFTDLLKERQVQMALAVALYTATEEIKKSVLLLTSYPSFPAECVSRLAQCMADLNQLVMLAPMTNTPHGSHSGSLSGPCSVNELTPLFTVAQENRLDSFIKRMEDAFNNKEIQNITTSAVMELYQYKLAAMGHAERATQGSLEAANAHTTHLQHRLAQMAAEVSRLHQLLYAGQQTLEGSKAEVATLRQQLVDNEATASATYIQYNQLLQDMNSKTRIIAEQSERIDKLHASLQLKDNECLQLQKMIESINSNIQSLEKSLEVQKAETEELAKVRVKLEELLDSKHRTIKEKDKDIENRVATNKLLEKELVNSKAHISGLEQTINDKNIEISDLQKQLSDLQRKVDMIVEISMGNKSMMGDTVKSRSNR